MKVPYSHELKANTEDPDQTAPKEQSDQGLQYLPFHQVFYEKSA